MSDQNDKLKQLKTSSMDRRLSIAKASLLAGTRWAASSASSMFSSEEEKEKKMQFYKKEISEKYHIPVRFLLAGPDSGVYSKVSVHRRIFPKKESLEQKVSSVVAIAGLVSSLFFLRHM